MVINIYFYSCEKQTAHTWKEKGWCSNTKKKKTLQTLLKSNGNF